MRSDQHPEDAYPDPVSDPEAEGLPGTADDDSTAYDDVASGRQADGRDPAALPADRPLAVDRFGTTPAEVRAGAPLDERLAAEIPDPDPWAEQDRAGAAGIAGGADGSGGADVTGGAGGAAYGGGMAGGSGDPDFEGDTGSAFDDASGDRAGPADDRTADRADPVWDPTDEPRDPVLDDWSGTDERTIEDRPGEFAGDPDADVLAGAASGTGPGLDRSGPDAIGFDGPPETVGRLVAPDEGTHPDLEKDEVARDAGAAGGGPSAEEAAMHVTEPPP